MRYWDRTTLKTRAKAALRSNYFLSVIVGIIATIVANGAMGGGTSLRLSLSDTVEPMEAMTPEQMQVYIDQIAEQIRPILPLLLGGIAIASVLSILIGFFVVNPLYVGCDRFFYQNIYQKATIDEVAVGFRENYRNVVKVMFLKDLKVFLWSLLFIIPGIIKNYEYRMVPYLLAENPNVDASAYFAKSKQMMEGNKGKAFVLDLSFLGWYMLSLLTTGILQILFVAPYVESTNAQLYASLKGEDPAKIRPELYMPQWQTPGESQSTPGSTTYTQVTGDSQSTQYSGYTQVQGESQSPASPTGYSQAPGESQTTSESQTPGEQQPSYKQHFVPTSEFDFKVGEDQETEE